MKLKYLMFIAAVGAWPMFGAQMRKKTGHKEAPPGYSASQMPNVPPTAYSPEVEQTVSVAGSRKPVYVEKSEEQKKMQAREPQRWTTLVAKPTIVVEKSKMETAVNFEKSKPLKVEALSPEKQREILVARVFDDLKKTGKSYSGIYEGV